MIKILILSPGELSIEHPDKDSAVDATLKSEVCLSHLCSSRIKVYADLKAIARKRYLKVTS